MNLRKIALAALLTVATGLASQSLQSGTGTATLPAGAPWNALTNWRAEVRLHAWNYNGAFETIIGTSSFALRVASYSQIVLTSWHDGSAACGLNPAGIADVIIRVQRDATNSRLTVEAWNAVDGSGYQQAVCTVVMGRPNDSGSPVWVGGFSGALAYARVYSTVVPLGTAPGNKFDGDLVDYELENSGLDSSPHTRNLTMVSPVYIPTPVYPPAAVFGQSGRPRTFRAGSRVLLDATTSFSSTDNATLRHFWQQIDGPATGKFSQRTLPTTSFSAIIAGTYAVQDTVCDSLGACGSAAHTVGAVATDPGGFVITGNPLADFVLGPLTMSGTSPWPWYDITEGADADVLAPYQENVPSSVPMSGIVTTGGADRYSPVSLTGTGTHFLTETAVGNVLFINWLTPDGLRGSAMALVASIFDDTHLMLDRQLNPLPFPTVGAQISTSTDPTGWGTWGLSSGRGTDWNFYDDALALYRHYYRTGRGEYLVQARTLADNWYHYALDHGYGFQNPRAAGLQGIIMRALDGRPEYWTGILAYMNFPIGWQAQFSQTTPSPPGSSIDPREYGYMLRWGALIAKVHPDAAIRTLWCSNITNAVTNVWPAVQDSLGNFEEDVYSENPGYPYAPTNGLFGSSPWRSTIGLLGLQKAYEVLADPSACNEPAVASATLGIIEKFTNFAHDYGKGGNRGQLYSVNYLTIGQDPLGYQGFNANTPKTTGTLSVSPGSTIVRGTGTHFVTVFWHAPCVVSQPWCRTGAVEGQQAFYDGQYQILRTNFVGIPSECRHLTLQVASVESDTQLTLATPWPSYCPVEAGIGTNAGANGVGWVATWEGNTQCGQYSAALHCEGGPDGDRNLTHDIHEAYLWLYQNTGNPTYYLWGQDSLGADYGGSAGGPGSALPFAGPQADGNTGFMQDPIQPCQISSPPCGGNGPTNNQGKAFGQSSGAGNAANAIARYLGNVAPQVLINSYITFNPNVVGASGGAQIRVTAPNGASNTFQCPDSPCVVTYDARQGSSQAVLMYLSDGGSVLSTSEPFPIQ